MYNKHSVFRYKNGNGENTQMSDFLSLPDEPLTNLLIGKLQHLIERFASPPETIVEQVLLISKHRINVFRNDVVFTLLKQLLQLVRRPNKKSGISSNDFVPLSVFAANTLFEIHRSSQNWPLFMLECYIDDSLGQRQWVDCQDCKILEKNLLCWTTDDIDQENKRYDKLNIDVISMILNRCIPRLGISLSSVVEIFTPNFGKLASSLSVDSSANNTRPPSCGGWTIVSLLGKLCGLMEVRLLSSILIEKWLSNPALVDFVKDLTASVISNIQHISGLDDGTAVDLMVVDNVMKLRHTLKASHFEFFKNCLEKLINNSDFVAVRIFSRLISEDVTSSMIKPETVRLLCQLVCSTVKHSSSAVPQLLFPHYSPSVPLSHEHGARILGISVGEICTSISDNKGGGSSVASEYRLIFDLLNKVIKQIGIQSLAVESMFEGILSSVHNAVAGRILSSKKNKRCKLDLELFQLLSDVSVNLQLLLVNEFVVADRETKGQTALSHRISQQQSSSGTTSGRTLGRTGGVGAPGRGRGLAIDNLPPMFRSAGALKLSGRGPIAHRPLASTVKPDSKQDDSGGGVPSKGIAVSKNTVLYRSCRIQEISLFWITQLSEHSNQIVFVDPNSTIGVEMGNQWLNWISRVLFVQSANISRFVCDVDKAAPYCLRDNLLLTESIVAWVCDVLHSTSRETSQLREGLQLLESAIIRSSRTILDDEITTGCLVESCKIIPYIFRLSVLNVQTTVENRPRITLGLENIVSNGYTAMQLGEELVDDKEQVSAISDETLNAPYRCRLSIPYLTSRILYWNCCQLCFLLSCVRPDTFGQFIWKYFPNVQKMMLMCMSSRFSSQEELQEAQMIELSSETKFQVYTQDDVSVAITTGYVALLTSGAVSPAVVIDRLESEISDYLFGEDDPQLSGGKRQAKRKSIYQEEHQEIVSSREKLRERKEKEKADRAERAAARALRIHGELADSDSYSGVTNNLDSSELATEEDVSPGDVSCETTSMNISMSEPVSNEFILPNKPVGRNKLLPFVTQFGAPTQEDVMFLKCEGITRKIPDEVVDSLRSLDAKFSFGERLRGCTNPDFIHDALLGEASSDDAVHRNTIEASAGWLIDAICVDTDTILRRIPNVAVCYLTLIVGDKLCEQFRQFQDSKSYQFFDPSDPFDLDSVPMETGDAINSLEELQNAIVRNKDCVSNWDFLKSCGQKLIPLCVNESVPSDDAEKVVAALTADLFSVNTNQRKVARWILSMLYDFHVQGFGDVSFGSLENSSGGFLKLLDLFYQRMANSNKGSKKNWKNDLMTKIIKVESDPEIAKACIACCRSDPDRSSGNDIRFLCELLRSRPRLFAVLYRELFECEWQQALQIIVDAVLSNAATASIPFNLDSGLVVISRDISTLSDEFICVPNDHETAVKEPDGMRVKSSLMNLLGFSYFVVDPQSNIFLSLQWLIRKTAKRSKEFTNILVDMCGIVPSCSPESFLDLLELLDSSQTCNLCKQIATDSKKHHFFVVICERFFPKSPRNSSTSADSDEFSVCRKLLQRLLSQCSLELRMSIANVSTILEKTSTKHESSTAQVASSTGAKLSETQMLSGNVKSISEFVDNGNVFEAAEMLAKLSDPVKPIVDYLGDFSSRSNLKRSALAVILELLSNQMTEWKGKFTKFIVHMFLYENVRNDVDPVTKSDADRNVGVDWRKELLTCLRLQYDSEDYYLIAKSVIGQTRKEFLLSFELIRCEYVRNAYVTSCLVLIQVMQELHDKRFDLGNRATETHEQFYVESVAWLLSDMTIKCSQEAYLLCETLMEDENIEERSRLTLSNAAFSEIHKQLRRLCCWHCSQNEHTAMLWAKNLLKLPSSDDAPKQANESPSAILDFIMYCCYSAFPRLYLSEAKLLMNEVNSVDVESTSPRHLGKKSRRRSGRGRVVVSDDESSDDEIGLIDENFDLLDGDAKTHQKLPVHKRLFDIVQYCSRQDHSEQISLLQPVLTITSDMFPVNSFSWYQQVSDVISQVKDAQSVSDQAMMQALYCLVLTNTITMESSEAQSLPAESENLKRKKRQRLQTDSSSNNSSSNISTAVMDAENLKNLRLSTVKLASEYLVSVVLQDPVLFLRLLPALHREIRVSIVAAESGVFGCADVSNRPKRLTLVAKTREGEAPTGVLFTSPKLLNSLNYDLWNAAICCITCLPRYIRRQHQDCRNLIELLCSTLNQREVFTRRNGYQVPIQELALYRLTRYLNK